APAHPFCSHLYSDSIQGSIRASQTTGRTGEVDNLGQDLLLESSTDHRPRTRTRRLPTFNPTAPQAASDGIRRYRGERARPWRRSAGGIAEKDARKPTVWKCWPTTRKWTM
ncbi:MAG: hypothetical protein ACK55Z_10200, partial [bacterium]